MRKDNPGVAVPEESFAPTQLVETVARDASMGTAAPPPETAPQPADMWTARVAMLRRVSTRLQLAARKNVAMALRPDNRGRAGLVGLVVLLSAALAWKSLRSEAALTPHSVHDGARATPVREDVEEARARGDSVMVLALLMKDDSASALLLRAESLVRIGRNAEAFELLDRASRVDASVRSEPAFVRGAVASLSAVAGAKVATLLSESPDELVKPPLTEALGSADYRQRHGAQYVLTQRGQEIDDTAILSLDLLQLRDCDGRAAVAKALVRRLEAKPQVEHILAYAKSRDRDACLSNIVARRGSAKQ